MKKTRVILSVACLGLLAATLSACNKPKDKFEISISARHMTSEIAMLELWAREYEATHPNIKINVSDWGDTQGTSEGYISKTSEITQGST